MPGLFLIPPTLRVNCFMNCFPRFLIRLVCCWLGGRSPAISEVTMMGFPLAALSVIRSPANVLAAAEQYNHWHCLPSTIAYARGTPRDDYGFDFWGYGERTKR
jgi:hypothetical protein